MQGGEVDAETRNTGYVEGKLGYKKGLERGYIKQQACDIAGSGYTS